MRGPKPPIAIAVRYAARLDAWLQELQYRIRAAALSSHHLKKDAKGEAATRISIITHKATLPVDTIEQFGAAVDAHNIADTERVLRVVGIPLVDTGAAHDVVAVFRDTNVALIQSLAADQGDEITALLATAELEGMHASDLADLIEARFDVGRSRADLIARDQVLKLNGQLTERRQTGAGVSQYVWTTAGDDRVREGHAELEGTTQQWGAPPVTNEKTGDTNAPGGDFQCRCIAFPLVEF